MRTMSIGFLGFVLCVIWGCPTTPNVNHPNAPRSFVAPKTQSNDTYATIDSKRVIEAALHYPKKEAEAVQQVPMSLTASDGTGLRLVGMDAKAVIQGPLAFTELHLTFHNPESRTREGRFEITLPTGASISRFAMKLYSGWQEAEVVERQKARQVYEDFLHRKQDPALLEKKAGNQFRARIFPIPGNANKEIIISYSQNLAQEGQSYRLPLKGLPKIDSLKILAFVSEQSSSGQKASSLGGVTVSQKTVRVEKSNYAPDRDFEVASDSRLQGLRNGNLALVRVKPQLSNKPADMLSLLVLVDTSASRAAGFYQQVEQLGAVIHHLRKTYKEDVRLHIACYDQTVGSVYDGPISQLSQQHLDLILARRALGASNLHAALGWVGKTRGYRRVVLVTDGIATAGQTEGGKLRDAVKALAAEVHRLDVMLVGGINDEAGMRKLVAGTLEHDGVVLDGGRPAAEIADRLSRTTVSGLKVAVPGAKWIWPRRVDGIQPGDHFLVFADLPDGALVEGKALTVKLSGAVTQQLTASVATVERPLVQRAWIGARIAHLDHQADAGELDPDMATAVRKQIIDLSTKHRVLSDYTALLVLESESDYSRYGIKRTALADILVVGATGVEVKQRNQMIERIRRPPPPPPPPRPVWNRPRSRSEGDDIATRHRASRRPPRAPSANKSVAAPLSEPRDTLGGRADSPVSSDSAERESAPPRLAKRRSSARMARPPMEAPPRAPMRPRPRPMPVDKQLPEGPPALSGKVAAIVEQIKQGQTEAALVDALRWRAEQPGDVMALVALGEATVAQGRPLLAARVYGSIIDLFPSRADMRRFAGERLEALGKVGLELAEDSYLQAVKQRPDHQSSHRLYAFALVRNGKYAEALAALEAGLKQSYRIGRSGTERIMREDLGLVAAALVAAEPNKRAEVEQRLAKHNVKIASEPSLRFVLTWQTDANDVDFHIFDGQGGHASYRNKTLGSGGVLFADVTNGYGPECFAIPGKAAGFPYRLSAHYYSRGPMGYGMGKVQVIQHDGQGGLRFAEHPFVVMNDRAYVDLGTIKGPL